MTNHPPFVPKEQKYSKGYNLKLANYLRFSLKQLNDLYDDSVYTFDRYMGKMVKILKEKGIYEDTIIILTADHGELLGEYGRMNSHPSELLFEEKLTKVPLIIKFDENEFTGKVDRIFSLKDLFSALIFPYMGIGEDKIKLGNNHIFLEARNFSDAFQTYKKDKQSKVNYFVIRDENHYLFYNRIKNESSCNYDKTESTKQFHNVLNKHFLDINDKKEKKYF